MISLTCRATFGLLLLVAGSLAGPAYAQDAEVLLFDAETPDAYWEHSSGTATGGDELLLVGPGGDRLPVEEGAAYAGAQSGLLRYRHVPGGSWAVRVGVVGEAADLSAADTLVLYLNAPAPVAGTDLPQIALEDAQGRRTALLPIRLGNRVGYDPVRSGFQEGAATDLALGVSYTSSLPAERSRTGYPEDLYLVFSDDVIDTSAAAIGVPATPVRLTVETTDGSRLRFRFRDLDGDRTLGTDGEYLDILTPDPDDGTPRVTWRVEVTRDASALPGTGDVFLLAVDNRGVDADPEGWQRVTFAMQAFGPFGSFDPASVAAFYLANGTAATPERTVWVDEVRALVYDEDVPAPAAPEGVEAVAGDSSVVLHWQPAAGATGYHVYRQAAPEEPFERITESPASASPFADVDAENGQTHTYVVRSVGPGGVLGPDSAPVEATPRAGLSDAFLDLLARTAFDYFWEQANPENGLVRDRSTATSPASIAAIGFGLSALTAGIDRGWISRSDGAERVRRTLDFLWNAPQGTGTYDTGYRGFFYHFLEMETGRRAWSSELSTIDTALLMAGVLHARVYFDREGADEARIRELADALYHRVEWDWMMRPSGRLSMGWKPESGFLEPEWAGYNEAMVLYLLALGSPAHPIQAEAWSAWTSTYTWATHYGYSFVEFPPLFGHQYSHVWFDFRGLRDAYMRERGIDYFENSRRATLAQRAYHVANPGRYPNYGPNEWGLTASDIPGGYLARGAPPGMNDEGTLAPTAPGGSVAFTPEASSAALRQMYRRHRRSLWGPYGFRDAYNVARSWYARDYLGIDQGPILLMIENHQTGRIWEVFMQHEAVQRGLTRAGFATVTAVAPPEGEQPRGVALYGAFPNPFDRAVTLRYALDRPARVVLTVYDLLGRAVTTLVDEARPLGEHELTFDAAALAPGVYVATLRSGGQLRTAVLVRRGR